MPWVIIRTLLITQSRLYLQYSFHMALKTQMINQQIISTIESHILTSNSTEAWILLNLICGKIKSKEPDSLIHCFISYHSSKEWNNEQNLLIALEVLNTCAKDFSYSALNNVFKHLLKTIKSGMIIPQVIGKAFDFLSTIDHRLRANKIRSTPTQTTDQAPSQEWIIELHNYLEEKLLIEMSNFPENRSVNMSHLYSYSEANLEIKQRPHPDIISFINRYIMACIDLPESELEMDNDRIFNSMILISGRFSIQDSIIAERTCRLYGKILKAIDRPSIVNTILVAVSDLCKKHTQIVETILECILEKLSSPYLINRLETFKSFASLVLQDQLKLRGSLLLAMLGVILDENQNLSDRAMAFFMEFSVSKNPALFHKCLIECPFVLNEYSNFEGLDTFTENMIKSPLKGDNKLKTRYKLYDHFMQSIDDVNLTMHFNNLKILAEKQDSINILEEVQEYLEGFPDYMDFEYLEDDTQDAQSAAPSSIAFSKMDNDQLPQEINEKLIEAVEKRPALWNIKHIKYRDRTIRTSLWSEIVEELNLDETYLKNLRKRWDSIKTGHSRSKKGVPSGSGGNKNPPYKYGGLLSFLNDTQEPRKTITLMSEAALPIESLEPLEPASKKKKASQHTSYQAEALQLLKEINNPQPVQQKEKSYAVMTCDLIARDMETLPEEDQWEVRRELFQVIDAAVLRHRNRGTEQQFVSN